MKILLTATCLMLSAALATAQDIADLRKSFWDRLDAIEIEQEEKLRQLNTNYEAALRRLLQDFQKSGKLDEVLIVRDQISNIKIKDTEAQDSVPKGPKELLSLREKYVESRGKILESHAAEVVTLVDRADTLLEGQIVALTKAGKIDEAVKAKETLERIRADKLILAARRLSKTNVPATGGWISLTAADMHVVKKEQYYVGWLKEPENDKKQETSEWGKTVRTQSDKKPVLLSHPNCTIRFRFRSSVTRFRANLSLADARGNVTFILLVDGREIKREALSGSVHTKPFECTFPKTNEIELQVDFNGAIDYDWASWINPEVR